jgi:predicted acyl esterase
MKIRFPVTLFASILAISILLTSCSSPALPNQAPAVTNSAFFTGHGSIDNAYVIGAHPGESLNLVNSNNQIVQTSKASYLGSAVFNYVIPGSGYSIQSSYNNKVYGTGSFSVMSPTDIPPESFYSSQHMHVGLNYIKMRDGITLAATLRLPAGKTLSDGPFPTVIEYSGYSIGAPGNFLKGLIGIPQKYPAPSSSTVIGSFLAPSLGFASVDLQMRGTGCSGGAYDLFGPLTAADGYDAVQIISSQSWVKNHKVGLVGISYSGISQWFVAATRPPGLAAIAPMSPTNNLYDTGYPGGMYNNGFAAEWIQERIVAAQAAPKGGQEWAKQMIALGDKTCLANQVLHPDTLNVHQIMTQAIHYIPSLFNVRNPSLNAEKINVPVLLASSFQDEETGGQQINLLSYLKNDAHVYSTLTNGTHIDPLGPANITKWLEFLQIFVGNEVPHAVPGFSTLMNLVYQQLTGSATPITLTPMQFVNAKSVSQAKQEFEKSTPRVDVFFDNGGSSVNPGAMQPEWSASFNNWPPKSATVTTYYLGVNGGLTTSNTSQTSDVSYKPVPLLPRTDLPSGNVWANLPPYQWNPVPSGQGIGFITKPLTQDEVVVGPASLNLMLKSTAPDTDIQVEVSEVLPNGKEMYVQSGWLRASDRALNTAESTVLHPSPTFYKSTASPLPKGKFTLVRVPIFPIGFAFRKGSRLRIVISAPGDDTPEWAFDTYQTNGTVTNTVELGGSQPSTLVLPVEAKITPKDPQPQCPSNRGEPCRTYVPESNGG